MTTIRPRLIDDALYTLALLVPVAIGASRYVDAAAENRALLLAQQRHTMAVTAAKAAEPAQVDQVSR
jgi:hypothetical protein